MQPQLKIALNTPLANTTLRPRYRAYQTFCSLLTARGLLGPTARTAGLTEPRYLHR